MCPWKFWTIREKLQKSVRESDFLYVKKLEKRTKNSFTHTFYFHVGKKNTELDGVRSLALPPPPPNIWLEGALGCKTSAYLLSWCNDQLEYSRPFCVLKSMHHGPFGEGRVEIFSKLAGILECVVWHSQARFQPSVSAHYKTCFKPEFKQRIAYTLFKVIP